MNCRKALGARRSVSEGRTFSGESERIIPPHAFAPVLGKVIK